MRHASPKVRRGTLALLSLLAIVSLPDLASGQTWLGEVRITSGLTQGTPSVPVRPGDQVVVEAVLNIGPGGPSPTTMNVWTASGHSFTLGPGRTSATITFLATAASD